VPSEDVEYTRVMALHALAYCERLFYLEEVEEIRIADEAVFAGRTLHQEIEDAVSVQTMELTDEDLGLTGKVDAIRRRDGVLVPYEHKRGRSAGGEAWETDQIQVGAYAMLIERATGEAVPEGRVRYHADGKTVRVAVDQALREKVMATIRRAAELRGSLQRPPVAANERLCVRCSLAPVCLPEEERKAEDEDYDPIRLFPPGRDRLTVHVMGHGTRVGRSGDAFKITTTEGEEQLRPAVEVGELVLHGYSQITAQAIGLCVERDVGLHWMTGWGQYLGGLTSGPGKVQRRIRQYEALRDPVFRLRLARRLVLAKVSDQMAFLLRATRGKRARSAEFAKAINSIRAAIRGANRAVDSDALRGHEGEAGRAYFSVLPHLLIGEVPESLRYCGRTRRPPKDRFSALLNYGYGLLYRQVAQAILSVGLEPAFGFYHTPRTAALPLVLDLMELFRVPLWDMVVVASLNRRQWDPSTDFSITREKVWLSDCGRKKAVALFEQRLCESWRHPVVGYSMEYARLVELEARLLEKEWTIGHEGLFARMRRR